MTNNGFTNKIYPNDFPNPVDPVPPHGHHMEFKTASKNEAAVRIQMFHAAQDGNVDFLTYLSQYAEPRLTSFDFKDAHGVTALHYAAKGGHAEVAQFLLAHKVDVNEKDPKGQTALHYAVRYQQAHLVLLLSSYSKVQVNAKDHMQTTPLLLACKRGYTDIAKTLLARGANAGMRGRDKITTLHSPCLMGNTELVQILIQHGAVVDGADVNGVTPLMSAAIGGHVAVMDLLMAQAPKKILLDEDVSGATALMYAIQTRSLPFVDACIQRGAPINAVRTDGNTALHIAASLFFNEFIQRAVDLQCDLNVTDDDGRTPLHICALNNNLNGAKLLLAHGAYSNAPDKNFDTPAHYCAQKGHLVLLQCLGDNMANLGAKNDALHSPLHIAVMNNQKEVVKFLLQKTDVCVCNFTDRRDRTALHYAAEAGHLELVRQLVEKGSKLCDTDDEEKIPLHLAILNSHIECVQWLLARHKQEGSFKESIATLSVLIAAAQGKKELFHYIVEQGVDIAARDEGGRNPLMTAALHGHMDIVNYLLERDYDIHAEDIQKNTALHYASRGGSEKCVTLLLREGAKLTENSLGRSPFDLALRNVNEAARVFISPPFLDATMSFRYHNGTTHMRSMLEFNPRIAEEVMDMCISENTQNHLDADYTVRYDFRYIDPGPDDRSSKFFWQRYYAMADMVKFSSFDLLEHPLLTKYLQYKWSSLGSRVFFLDLFFYAAFLTCLTVFYLTNDAPSKSSTNTSLDSNTGCVIDTSGNSTSENREAGGGVDVSTQIILWCLLAIRLAIELLKIFTKKHMYFLSGSSYLYLAMYICTAYFIRNPTSKPCVFEWRLGVVAVFMAWFFFILQWDQIQFIGIYVLMYQRVFLSILKVAPIYVILSFAFSLAFRTTLKTSSPFSTLGYAFLKTVDMSVGEVEFVSYFFQVDNHFTDLNYVLFLAFIWFLAIIMMNLLIGVAVGDIDRVMSEAHILFTSKMIHYIIDIETKVPKFIQRAFYEPETEEQPNRDRFIIIEHVKSALTGVIGPSAEEKSQEEQEAIEKRIKGLEDQMNARFERLENLLKARK